MYYDEEKSRVRIAIALYHSPRLAAGRIGERPGQGLCYSSDGSEEEDVGSVRDFPRGVGEGWDSLDLLTPPVWKTRGD